MVIICAMLVGLGVGRAEANDNPGIIPIAGPGPHANYGSLAAAWWRWAAQTPAPDSAVLDTTGANCAKNQIGPTWFLAGTNDGSSVTRTCTVPSGKSLFFPLENDFYGAFITDPARTKSESFLRSQVVCVEQAIVTATIDGVPVNDPAQYLEKSTLFSLQLPEDNIFGVTADLVPKLILTPVVDEGYYLYLSPLTPGTHTIQFTADPNGSTCALPQDVTYTLTVQ
jgi:hypothetical protein